LPTRPQPPVVSANADCNAAMSILTIFSDLPHGLLL
jgi:hypothetical protein